MPLVLLLLLGGGGLLVMSHRRRAKEKKKLKEGPVPYDVYPRGTSKQHVAFPPYNPYVVTSAPDCSIIAVPHGWWDGIAKPTALSLNMTPTDTTLEIIVKAVPGCAASTKALYEFADDVKAAVIEWRGETQTTALAERTFKK